jgi:hypothetical protein
MDPGAGGVGQILAAVVGYIPLPGPREPEDPLLRREVGGRPGVVAGGTGEGGGIHDGENDWQSGRLPSFLYPVMKGISPVLFAACGLLSVQAAELPQLNVKPWIGNYAGYERRSFQFLVSNSGVGQLTGMGEKGVMMSSRYAIRIQPLVEDVLADGGAAAKMPVKDGWEAVTPASIDPEKLVYRGTVAGGARFEVTFEFDGDEIRAGGKLLEKGSLANPRFVLRFQVPDAYYHENDLGKRQEKAKRDRVDLLRSDGKKLKLDLVTPLDAESGKFSGPGISQARLDISGFKGHRFEFDAGANAAFEFWNQGEQALIEGFTLGWKPDATKDPDGKARMVLKVR